MPDKQKLVIVGASVFPQIAYEYFSHDSPYEVVAFSVEEQFLIRPTLFHLPVVPFEQLEHLYQPAEHALFVAVVFPAGRHGNRSKGNALQPPGAFPLLLFLGTHVHRVTQRRQIPSLSRLRAL